jgi:FkbM family methyltransferase
MFVSYAQNYEDVILWRALGHLDGGWYVDAGAAHPDVDSVTRALYERGWRGIDVEPVPAYASALRDARPADVVVECALGESTGTATLSVVDGTGLSTLTPEAARRARNSWSVSEVEVQVRRLDDVLAEHMPTDRIIHLLKIDVEGFEQEVLRGIDLARWRPWVVMIEATAPGSTELVHDRWESMLLEAGYQFCLFDGLNRIYVHEDHQELVPSLSYPVSPFDEPYERYRDAAVRIELGECRGEVERRELLVGEIQRQLDLMRSDRDAFIVDRNRWRHRALDESARIAGAQARASEAISSAAGERHGRHLAEEQFRLLAGQVGRLEVELEAMRATVSWRLTAPIRAVRRLTKGGARSESLPAGAGQDSKMSGAGHASHASANEQAVLGAAGRRSREDIERADAFRRRARTVAGLLCEQPAESTFGPAAGDDPLVMLGKAFATAPITPYAAAWLGHVVAAATYPTEDEVRAGAREFRRLGPGGFADQLAERFGEALDRNLATPLDIDPIVDGAIADVTHTVQHDLQTGIQRVVRETVSRWTTQFGVIPVWWDYSRGVLRRLEESEVDRLVGWREHLPASHGTELSVRSLDSSPATIVIPWRSFLVLPELTAEPARTEGYRALACSGVTLGISLIGYDMIPVTAAETVTEDMSRAFSLYLSMVKRSTRLSAISEAAASDFRGFNAALASQGLSGPTVRAHLLPPSPTPITEEDLRVVQEALGVGLLPLVLVVGSHEPRKNHLAVLEAAEMLWSDGLWFDLVFIGGSGWRSEAFDREVERLKRLDRPVQVRRRATETELWASYRLARFSVFPSLLEGYGLPIVESIACGTPVITTDYGSMREIGVGGGAVMVDPHDTKAMALEMRRLLVDDEALELLRMEAQVRSFGTWDSYAASVWEFLVGEDGSV